MLSCARTDPQRHADHDGCATFKRSLNQLFTVLCYPSSMDSYQHPKSRWRAPYPVREDRRHFPRLRRDTVEVVAVGGCVLVLALFVATGAGWFRTPSPRLGAGAPARPGAGENDAYYANCDAARAAGVAPIARGAPGYRPALDRDDDGWACEPYPR